MTDRMTPEQRHRCMSHIRSKATKPELAVRRWLWNHGYRYRLNVKSVPGKPDIVMRPYRTAIFVNGCFWHGHNVRMRECGNALMRESEEPRSGNNLQDLQNFASAEREQENKDLPNSACCKIPQSNRDFWISKIRRNQERDQRNYALLQDNGWQVIVVWECQLKPAAIERTMREVELRLNNNLLSLYRHKPHPYSTDENEPLPMAAESNT